MTQFFRGAILGAPASGKGTISQKISQKFDVIHISTGDLFRQNVHEKTKLGASVQKYITEGKLVPDVLVVRMVLDKLRQVEGSGWHWLIDGFPRTLTQAEKLFMSYPLTLAISLHVPYHIIMERAKGRWVHIPSGRVYNTDFHPPKVPGKDDVTGEPLVQRPDDKMEAVLERLNIYTRTMGPLMKFYKKKGILREFEGNSSEEMWVQIEKVLLEYLDPKS